MDFPIVLEDQRMVDSSLEEKKQEIYVVLKQQYGSILQDYRLGSNISEHMSDNQLTNLVRSALSNIKGLSSIAVSSADGEVFVSCFYRGENLNVSYEP